MKLIYILSLGHSGSTLLDCILGTHPSIVSSGELRYLQWQLERTKGRDGSIAEQDICTCGENFRDCEFWSKVIQEIDKELGINMVENPRDFDTAFFNQFAYQDLGGFINRVKGKITRLWLERGLTINIPLILSPRIKKQLANKWLLYKTMSRIANKEVVVDSSKHLTQALLLQKMYPDKVIILFLHRDIMGLVSSAKKYGRNNIDEVIAQKKQFSNLVELYKANIKNLEFLEVSYERLVENPREVISSIERITGIDSFSPLQNDDHFFIDPSKLHIVAGNPMRFKGNMKVRHDYSWKSRLTEKDIDYINSKMDVK